MNTMRKCPTCGITYAGDLCPTCMAGFAQKPSEPGKPFDSGAAAALAQGKPEEELPLQPGQTFHGLEIIELLGRGGMGVVYKARQPALDRLVALKILPRKMALDPDFQSRFIREAKALGALSHPNIVAIHDFGAEAGLFFFAMEFVDGVNVRQIIRDRKLTPEQAFKIVPQLCDALEYAHGEGVVHRDIKPENIMLDKKGRVKIADFGLAKLVGTDTAAQQLTMTNMVMGTPHYMAPEQVENPRSVDHRADIYSMGVVFYEMLTGELPIGRFEVPSKKVQIDVRLDEVVLKTLEKEPQKRYQSAADVKNDVTRATAVTQAGSYAPTVVTPIPAKKGSNAVLITAIVVGGIAVMIIAAVIGQSISNPAPVPAASMKTGEASAAILGEAAKAFDAGSYEEAIKFYQMSLKLDLGEKDKALALRRVEECKAKLANPGKVETIDLTRLHFGPDEKPLNYRFAPADKLIDRNPYPAKDPETLGRVAKVLDNIGLQNIAPSDLKEAYCSFWYGGVSVIALVTPIAERIEAKYKELKTPWNRWSHRKGELLVLAHTWRREERRMFNVLVGMVQKKLGIPDQVPDVPLGSLKLDKSDLPKGWTIKDESTQEEPPGLQRQYQAMMAAADNPSRVEMSLVVYEHKSLEQAKNGEESLLKKPTTYMHRKAEVRRSARTVVVLVLHGDAVGPFEKLAEKYRVWLGHPERTFDTVVPTATDLPEGYSFDKTWTDPKEILDGLALTAAKPADVARAWRATLKPRGALVLLEVEESQTRYAVKNQLAKIGPAEYQDSWVFGVQADDDPTLDDLENRMREKLGWDRNRPRYIKLSDARIPGELPAGLAYTAKDFNDYRDLEKYVADLPYKPGDVLLVKDFVVAHLAGPESAWNEMDAIEATLRKKMRMGPAKLEDVVRGAGLPEGSILDEPVELKGFADRYGMALGNLVGVWQAKSDAPQALIVECRDAPAAEALRKSLGAGAWQKGTFVAFAQGALSEGLRARLRAKK